MRLPIRNRLARVATVCLAAWVGLFLLAVGGHAPSDELAWTEPRGWNAAAGHQPWHTHFLRSAPPSWGHHRDPCAICLAQGNTRALESVAEGSRPGDLPQLPVSSSDHGEVLVGPTILPPSRAPPRA